MAAGRTKIREVIVVEGPSDVSAVRRAVDAELVTTGGFRIAADTIVRIRSAHERCGVIVLTDPDSAGEQIRRRIDAAVPGCKHAFVPRERCTRDGDVGVEHASAEDVLQALEGARCGRIEPREVFTALDLARYGLEGGPGAATRRAHVGRALGLGHGNARQLLRRLNHYGIDREELEGAIATIGEGLGGP